MKRYIEANLETIKNSNIGDILDSIDEETFAKYLDTGKYPPPDLIIRTG
jgi:undecaprenyl pyrophosphate synthase